MILTCPDCATSYFVDDAKIGPQGRAVRCAGCGSRWTATADAELELTQTPGPALAASAPEPPPLEIDAPLGQLRADHLAKVFRARTESRRSIREAAAAGAVWAMMGACVIALVGAGVVFKVDVVRLWPRAASAYAMAGLPVNATGLEFEGIAAHPSLQDGHAALVVSGKIRNVEDRTIAAPPLRIGLLDKAGKSVGAKVSDPENAAIPPGETRHFVVSLLDPPAAAQHVEISFVLEPRPARTTKQASASALRGAAAKAAAEPQALSRAPVEAVDATPLPEGDPLALTPHG
jgi:predicted Zn finger-like uncharacterized protein